MAANYETLKQRGFSDEDVERLPVGELMTCMQGWCGGR